MTQLHSQRDAADAALPAGAGVTGAKVISDAAVPKHYEVLLAKLDEAESDFASAEAPASANGRSSHLEEASSIVLDLLYSLDFKHGGELVPRLAALYGYIANELLSVGRTRDRVQLRHLRDMIITLQQSWFGQSAA